MGRITVGYLEPLTPPDGGGAMSRGQFRFSYFSAAYEKTVAFYRDGLRLPLIDEWERNSEDQGTLFGAASGLIEVLKRPESGDAAHFFDERPPQGAFMVIEVEDVEWMYRQVIDKGLPIPSRN
jgi:catechol 2,3-dioxygenase-like lactoylglutathione lyase family enzyme